MAIAMRAALQRLRVVPASDGPADLDRALAPILARLAAIEMQVKALTRQNFPPGGSFEGNIGTCSDKLDQLVAACLELGIPVSADGYVREYAAAKLLNRSAFTLRNWRYAEQPLRFRLLGGRIEYRLAELAAWLDRTEPH
jgi:hypothetical protein